MTSQQPPKSFSEKFGPQSSGQTPSAPYYQQPASYQGSQQASPYGSQYGQQSYQQSQQPMYQQSYQQPMYQQYYVPGIPDSARGHRTNSNICFILMILLIGGFFALAQSRNPQLANVASLLALGAAIMWVAAWCFALKAKGYSAWLGVLAFFGLIGMIVMLILPNKYKRH